MLLLFHIFVNRLGSARCFHTRTLVGCSHMVSGEETFEDFFIHMSGTWVEIVDHLWFSWLLCFVMSSQYDFLHIKKVSCMVTGNSQNKCSKRLKWRLQGFLLPNVRIPRHHFYHILVFNQVSKACPNSRKGDLHFTSQGEWKQSICAILHLFHPHSFPF